MDKALPDNSEKVRLFKKQIVESCDANGFTIKSRCGAALAYLRLIGSDDLQDEYLIQKITEWRASYKECFLSEFTPTCERTKAWMQKAVVNDPARALFRILSPDHALMGHVGAIHRGDYLEYDYYILGVRPEMKGFALNVASQFLIWLSSITKLKLISGNVRSDNRHALDFHRRTGFSEYKKIPLRRVESENGEITFEPDEGSLNAPLSIIVIRATAADLITAAER